MHTLKINLFSFLSPTNSSKKAITTKSSIKNSSKKEKSKKTSIKNNLPSNSKEDTAIYYLPVHLM
ncbi:hypothetical protein WAF17_05815 [Bernardetia sp. ABR2-2B]|uniref:hypothetical protein n=1 Tax=Bernardetia sp. ABR2-2B TaxID=3127472 RepID=UPI0030D21BC3